MTSSSAIPAILASTLPAASWIDITRRYLKERREDQFQPRLGLSTLWGPEIMDAIGCPAIAIKLGNDGPRTIKVSQLKVSVSGHDFMREINQGFNNQFNVDPPPVPELQKQTLVAWPLPATHPDNKSGWALERDDAAHWLFPAGNPGSNYFLDAKSNEIKIQATLRNGDTLDLADGSEFIKLLSPLFDKCVERNWMTTAVIQFAVSFASRTEPKHPKIGSVNSHEIKTTEPDSLMHLEDRMPRSTFRWVQPPRRRRTL